MYPFLILESTQKIVEATKMSSALKNSEISADSSSSLGDKIPSKPQKVDDGQTENIQRKSTEFPSISESEEGKDMAQKVPNLEPKSTEKSQSPEKQNLEVSEKNTISTEKVELQSSISEPAFSGETDSVVTTKSEPKSTQPIVLTENVAMKDFSKSADHFLVSAAPAEGPYQDEPQPKVNKQVTYLIR